MPRFNINTNDNNNGFPNTLEPIFKFEYEVSIIFGNRLFRLFAQKIDRPSVKVNTEEVWGLNDVLYLPGRRSYEPISITVVELEDTEFYHIYQQFEKYYGGENNNNGYRPNRIDDYSIKDSIQIIIDRQRSSSTHPRKYIFRNCFITDIKPEEFTYEGSDFMRYNITFRYDTFTIQ